MYVDDILITGSSSVLIHKLIQKLQSCFALKHLGTPEYFLGIEVKYLPSGSVILTQTKYTQDLLQRVNMFNCNPMSTPIVANLKLTKHGTDSLSDPSQYRSIVGGLQYITLTRPELTYSVNKICQFLSKPLNSHWCVVKRILRYLSGTITHGLRLQPASRDTLFSQSLFSLRLG